MPKSEVFLMDCMEGMKQFPDKYFDLAIVDPPYGIDVTKMNMGTNPTRSRNDGHGSGPGISTATRLRKEKVSKAFQGAGHFKNSMLNTVDWDTKPTPEYFEELFRVSKNQIIWGGNYFELDPCRCFVIWDKLQPWDNFSQVEFAWTSFNAPAKIFRHSNCGGANDEQRIHPTQKPVPLYRYLIDQFCAPEDKILDTHLGSGSHRIAAFDMGFDFTGYEIDKDYFEAQEKRFQNHKAQLKLFTS